MGDLKGDPSVENYPTDRLSGCEVGTACKVQDGLGMFKVQGLGFRDV